MEDRTDNLDTTGSHIWLRYATQFSRSGRTYTIEMGIPMPIGATTETRERLIHEAEAGMEQLSNHMDSRVAQMLQHPQPPQNTTATPRPVAPSQPVSKPNPSSSPPTVSAQLPPREEVQTQPPHQQPEKEVPVPPARANVFMGSSMQADTSGSLTLPQFLQIIKENLGLDARQAMDLLKVKTLSGLNLRDALEQLQQLVQEPTDTSVPTQKTRDESIPKPVQHKPTEKTSPIPTPIPSPRPDPSVASGSPMLSPTPLTPASILQFNPKKTPIDEISDAVVRDRGSAYTFDEEIDLDEHEEMEYPQGLTNHEREIAESIVSRLKEAHGSNPASPQRLTVLNNVMDSQISSEQLQQLIQDIWGVMTVKKLKNDQLEALISWAKEDDFVSEAELVLALMQEDEYARSDR